MTPADLCDLTEVEGLLRSIAAEHVMPRFGRVATQDVMAKADGGLVTAVDHTVEDALTNRLCAILPGSAVVGEEAVSADPTRLELVAGAEPVWIVDPIDGTENFAMGNPRFTSLVSLAVQGRVMASWTYAPALDLMAIAVADNGAHINGERTTLPKSVTVLRSLDVRVAQPRWWSKLPARLHINRLCMSGISLSYFDGAGLGYLELASGRCSAMILTWETVWDHAAGILLLQETGGTVTGLDGSPFRLDGDNELPLVAAPDSTVAGQIRAAMSDDEATVY
ncbi:hypothetical protein UK23_06070 [Lentzea aerocolonigenes]|uniref:inositol-phosphate phosphatase n=1 Tax=Lentzea aerocolonigenes TaxID=68170 RepID=A0A0F0H9Z6_LENAE|nr:inositol monophosphatase family protein [Lentzea aerocolonigenes]KJK51681.1 hypothetical protein UK23_06070 [Lentzea aerocolonigenes]